MKPALPTAPAAFGLNGPSATVTVDNATTAGLHLSQWKSVQTNGASSDWANSCFTLSTSSFSSVFQLTLMRGAKWTFTKRFYPLL